MEFTKSVWKFSAESAKRVGHPAPFPVELPYRLIQLYTFLGEVVIDPFIGSGTTAVAALQTGRHFVGYDIDPAYVKLAIQRVRQLVSQKKLFKEEIVPSSNSKKLKLVPLTQIS